MDDILSAANRSRAKNRIVILDCCHSGIMGSPNITEGKFSELADGVTVLTACSPAETATEKGGRGILPRFLSMHYKVVAPISLGTYLQAVSKPMSIVH